MTRTDLWKALEETQLYISKYYATALTDEDKHDQLKAYIEKFVLDNGYLVDGFTDEELEQAVKDMTSIIEIMDTIKEIDITYDPLKDNHNVYLKDLRKDEAKPSLPTEKLLQNAVSSENCFVVPKVVE